MNEDFFPYDPVIDRKREASRKQAMVSKANPMDPGLTGERVDVCAEGLQETVSPSRRLAFIKPAAHRQIFDRGPQDADFHENRRRSSALASLHSSAVRAPDSHSAAV